MFKNMKKQMSSDGYMKMKKGKMPMVEKEPKAMMKKEIKMVAKKK